MATMAMNSDLSEKPKWWHGLFERFMNGWRHVIQVSERTLIDNVAATVPWLAPVSPAYMVWQNAVTLLRWPEWVAWVMAAAVEGLGLSVVSTAFQLWREKRNTFGVAVATGVFYLAVVITVNVLLDLGAPVVIAKALLSLLSVPAAVTIALRTQNAQASEQERAEVARVAEEQIEAEVRAARMRLEEEERAYRLKVEDEERAYKLKVDAEQREYQRKVDAEERERRHELRMAKIRITPPQPSLRQEQRSERTNERSSFGEGDETFLKGAEGYRLFPETFRKWDDWRKVPAEERERIAEMTTAEVVERYGTIERTAVNWRKEAVLWKQG